MKNPLVSIVVTAYNRADMVSRALDSVLAQTYRPLELIVVDDESKDNTFEIIQEWVRQHPNTDDFTVTARTFPNGKLCVARNRGLELAHGEYIQYVDDDDWLYPKCIQQKMEYAAAHPQCDVIVHQVEYINKFDRSFGHSHLTLVDDYEQFQHLLNPNTETLFSPTLMFKSEKLRNAGAWTPGLIFADDIDVVLRMAMRGAVFGLVDKALSAYNMHDAHRQCTRVVYNLSDDFWSELFLRLYNEATECRTLNDTEKSLFAGQLELYGTRQLRNGRYSAAALCYYAAKKIAGPCIWHLRIPTFMRPLEMRLEFCVFKIFTQTKNLIKTMLRRS